MSEKREEFNKDNYSADSIQALEGMEHVRMRPSMYIGDVGTRGLHHLVYDLHGLWSVCTWSLINNIAVYTV